VGWRSPGGQKLVWNQGGQGFAECIDGEIGWNWWGRAIATALVYMSISMIVSFMLLIPFRLRPYIRHYAEFITGPDLFVARFQSPYPGVLLY
jgi:hypothetical protein